MALFLKAMLPEKSQTQQTKLVSIPGMTGYRGMHTNFSDYGQLLVETNFQHLQFAEHC